MWPEIQNELKPHQTASSRPDIVVRVFQLKLKALIDDLRYKDFFLNEPLFQEHFKQKKDLIELISVVPISKLVLNLGVYQLLDWF